MAERWWQTQIECGRIGQVCWLNTRLKKGQTISLEGDSRKWKVIEQFTTWTDNPGRRRWNVGGIVSEIAQA
jgi:hypothetical protein